MSTEWYDGEFYHEPTEFEEHIDSFKESLLNSVQDKYKSEMKRLRKENAELQVVKHEFEKIKSEYRQKELELEFEKKNMLRKVRGERLSTLMEDVSMDMYAVDCEFVKGDKCQNCDGNRRIHFRSPQGNAVSEACLCNKSKRVFSPTLAVCYAFKLQNWGDCDGMVLRYQLQADKTEDIMELTGRKIGYVTSKTKAADFEKMDIFDSIFKTIEECQVYCDWLNEQEKAKAYDQSTR